MADSIKTVLFKVDIDTKASQQQIKALKAEIKDMQKAVDSDAKATEAAAKRKEKAIKETTKALQAEEGSINALRKANKELTQERNNTTAATEEGRAKIKQLNDALDENNKKIRENVDAYTAQKINVGNYTESIKDAALQTNIGGLSIESLGQKVAALANPITGAVAALGALAAIYLKSSKGAEDLARAQNNMRASLDEFVNSVGNATGDGISLEKITRRLSIAFINLTSNTKETAEARKLNVRIAQIELETLRDLELQLIETNAKQKDNEREAENARRRRDDTEVSFQERLKATQEVKEKLSKIDVETVGILDRQLRALVGYGEATGKIVDGNIIDRELNIQILEIKNQIADKQEEINGKLTENVMAEKAIQKEIQAAREETRLRDQAAEDEEAAAYFQRIQNRLDAELFALQQRKEFEEEFYGEGGQITKIRSDFEKRLAAETKQRVSEQEAAEKKSAQLQLQIERNKSIALIGFTNMVTKERTVSRVLLSSLFKKDSIQETAIATKVAAVSAYKALAGIPYVGPILGGIAAAAVTAYGLATIAQIVGIPIGFAKGGITGTRIKRNMGAPINRDNGDDVLITAKSDEVILNKRQQRALGGDATFRKIGVPGFALGGITGATETAQVAAQIDQESVFNNMIDALSQTRTVLVLEDFEAKQSTVNGIKNKATVI
jgi:hypothetical protein